jgi:hypothetical protein
MELNHRSIASTCFEGRTDINFTHPDEICVQSRWEQLRKPGSRFGMIFFFGKCIIL